MRRHVVSASVLSLVLLLAVGCRDASGGGGPQPQSGLATEQVTLGSRTFTLEIADDDAKRETGLMYRDSMAGDHGMIFVFPDEQQRSFYMANTRIPLDIAFLDAGGTVGSIKTMKPLELSSTPRHNPAMSAPV